MIWNHLFALTLLTAAPLALAKAGAAAGERRPLKTKECVKKDAAGTCREWDTTFAVAGASCTENCVLFGVMDDCKVRNKCKYDQASGCFKKKVCQHTNAVDDCDKWREEPACR